MPQNENPFSHKLNEPLNPFSLIFLLGRRKEKERDHLLSARTSISRLWVEVVDVAFNLSAVRLIGQAMLSARQENDLIQSPPSTTRNTPICPPIHPSAKQACQAAPSQPAPENGQNKLRAITGKRAKDKTAATRTTTSVICQLKDTSPQTSSHTHTQTPIPANT